MSYDCIIFPFHRLHWWFYIFGSFNGKLPFVIQTGAASHFHSSFAFFQSSVVTKSSVNGLNYRHGHSFTSDYYTCTCELLASNLHTEELAMIDIRRIKRFIAFNRPIFDFPLSAYCYSKVTAGYWNYHWFDRWFQNKWNPCHYFPNLLESNSYGFGSASHGHFNQCSMIFHSNFIRFQLLTGSLK